MKNINLRKIFILTGHTASGKNALIDKLSTKIDTAIINADSIQVYKDNFILSAQPSLENKKNQYLYGFLDSCEDFNLNIMYKNILDKIEEAECEYIFITGGSPMYIRNILDGFSNIPSVNFEIIKSLEKSYIQDPEKTYSNLIKIDSKYANFIKQNDKKRIIRYLSVFEEFAIKIEDFEKKTGISDLFYTKKILLYIDRKTLYKNAETRLEGMLSSGAIQEVGSFLKKYKNRKDLDYKKLSIYKTIGFSEIEDYLDCKISWEFAVEKMKQRTRNYIKHQDTWYRNRFKDFLNINNFENFKDIVLS